jgi:hypothetical protein
VTGAGRDADGRRRHPADHGPAGLHQEESA